MRLYLSSFRMGDPFDQLIAAVPAGAQVAVVSNAADFIPLEDRLTYAKHVFDPVEHFRSHGLAADDLDLRKFFGDPEGLRAALTDVKLVWANGGNAFLLRRAMRQSGLDDILRVEVGAGALIYGGWSAGAAMAGPSLCGLHLMDEPQTLVEGYAAAPVWEGLDLVDVTIVPHFQSPHPESDAAAAAVAWLTAQGRPFRALRDGEVLIL